MCVLVTLTAVFVNVCSFRVPTFVNACGHGPAMVTLRVVRFLLFQFQGVARFFLAFCPSPKHFETGHGGSLHEDLFQERNSSIYALGWDMKVLVSMGMFPYLPPW